jgi:hypothetical protein
MTTDPMSWPIDAPPRGPACVGQRWMVYLSPGGGILGGVVEVALAGYAPAWEENRGGLGKQKHPGCWTTAAPLVNHHGVPLPFNGIMDTEDARWHPCPT